MFTYQWWALRKDMRGKNTRTDGGVGIRTPDLLNAIETRSQLRYTPMNNRPFDPDRLSRVLYTGLVLLSRSNPERQQFGLTCNSGIRYPMMERGSARITGVHREKPWGSARRFMSHAWASCNSSGRSRRFCSPALSPFSMRFTSAERSKLRNEIEEK